MSGSYSADDMQTLEGLEAVRKRPGMYIGSTDRRGLQHCLWEVVDNSVDEALAGFCSEIVVDLYDDGSASVRDNGRGIPVGVNKKSGITGVEMAFTKLHSGGKFGGGGYNVSGGLHGVGASVVNALSRRVDVLVGQGGHNHEISFSRGTAGVFSSSGEFKPKPGLRKTSKAKASGTFVRFWPDPDIFDLSEGFDFEATIDRARTTAMLVPALAEGDVVLSIKVTDHRGDEPVCEEFRFDGGISDFVQYHAGGSSLHDPIVIEDSVSFDAKVMKVVDGKTETVVESRACGVHVALVWSNTYEYTEKAYTNIIANPHGGRHVEGFHLGLVKTVRAQIDERRGLRRKNEDPPLKEDVLEGLTAVVLVSLAEPQFEGQTKETLGTPEVKQIVNDVTFKMLSEWFSKKANAGPAKAILQKTMDAARTRQAAKDRRDAERKKRAITSSSSLPAKLADARSKDRDEVELYIVEGDSAMGQVKKTREDHQAVIPVRGKVLNTFNTTLKKALSNAEVSDILAASGFEVGSDDCSGMRIGKIILLSDADADGGHINTLLLTLIYKLMRPMLVEGRVFIAKPPLFRVRSVDGDEYAWTYDERDAIVNRLTKAGRKAEVSYSKGLGEMDPDSLYATAVNPATRKIVQVTVDDVERVESMFDQLMGNSAAARREFVASRAESFSDDLIDA